MDDDFLEKIDSLWFFSSALSLRQRQSSQLLPQNAQISAKRHECTVLVKQEQAMQEPKTPKEPCQMDPKVKEGNNCKDIVGLEKRKVRKKGSKSKNRVEKWIEQSFAEMGSEERTPFAVLYDYQVRNKRSNEQVGGGSGFKHLSVPLVRDDFAMKEHLRSWAYAVASSVK